MTESGLRAQQLLDRAATLIQHMPHSVLLDGPAREWLRDYREEKARSGQPGDSPADDALDRS